MADDNLRVDLNKLDPERLEEIPDDEFDTIFRQVLGLAETDRRDWQLLYYQPASERAARIHPAMERVIGVGGGNRSSKTETVLAEICALATGVLPHSVGDQLRPKFRGPIKVRIVCESLTTVLHPIMLPKLKWWVWTGVDQPGGQRGHWGWIPRNCLIKGEWDASWSEKLRTLRVLCRDPDDIDKVLGESTIQFMSVDQDPSDFASGDLHIVMHDEPPSYAIWVENQARTMGVGGRMYLVMTFPDDPTIPVDWIFDELYEPGQPGPRKEKDKVWFDLWTTENRHLDQSFIEAQMRGWSLQTQQVRIYGQPIRFANLIHPLFTDRPQWWSFPAGMVVVPTEDGRCPETNSRNIAEFCHVQEFEHSNTYPCVFVLDPHPRKPHMFMWVQVDPSDDLWVIAEGEIDGDAADVATMVFNMEDSLGMRACLRLIDPNMGRSPSSASRRERTWQDEFCDAGLNVDLADDSDVGRARINEYLRPDEQTQMPRLHVHERCVKTIFQIKRYVWEDYKRKEERDLKQKAREKYDDYPTMLKYCLNYEPTFNSLHLGAPVLGRRIRRRGSYG